MTTIMTVNLALAAANVLLASVVATVFWRNHRQIKSPFTLALLLFAAFFVFHNAVLVYHYVTMMDAFGAVGEQFILVEGLLQTAALAALAYATLR